MANLYHTARAIQHVFVALSAHAGTGSTGSGIRYHGTGKLLLQGVRGMTVYCEKCGKVIGDAKEITYGGVDNDDHIDYEETEPNDYYGGEYLGNEYCEDCLCDLESEEEYEE
jgi:hypothetical protein